MGGGIIWRWLACILPCGALDIVRVVHIDGQVEEFSRPTIAGDVLAANPGHILSLPCSHGVVPRVLVVSPDSVLKRGHIYFLLPTSPAITGEEEENQKKKKKKNENNIVGVDQVPNNITVVRRSGHRRCRSVPAVVWRPQLQQIAEDPFRFPLPEDFDHVEDESRLP